MQLKTGPAFETTSHFIEAAGGWIKQNLLLCFGSPCVRDLISTLSNSCFYLLVWTHSQWHISRSAFSKERKSRFESKEVRLDRLLCVCGQISTCLFLDRSPLPSRTFLALQPCLTSCQCQVVNLTSTVVWAVFGSAWWMSLHGLVPHRAHLS